MTSFSFWGKVLGLFAVYFVAARFGLSISPVAGFATLVWPPTGIAIVALFIFGRKFWPSIFVGAFLINLISGAPILTALFMGIGNTLEAFLGAYILTRLGFKLSLGRIHDVLILVSLVGLGATAVSATIGVSSLLVSGIINGAQYFETWLAWWIGDMLGVLIVAPFLFVWLSREPVSDYSKSRFTGLKYAELILITILVALATMMVFGSLESGIIGRAHAIYLIFPPITLLAIRFGQKATVTSNLLLSGLAVGSTIFGIGPFVNPSLSETLLQLQLFIGVLSVTMMFLAAAVEESKKAQAAMSEFISIASHQLRTPVTSLKMIVELLGPEFKKLDPKSQSFFDMLNVSVGKMVRLVQDLLNVSHIEQVNSEEKIKIDLVPFVEKFLGDIKSYADLKNHNLIFQNHLKESVKIKFDPTELYNVLQNLVGNAIDYSPANGDVTVLIEKENHDVRLSVSQTGPAIPQEDQEKLFQKFYRGKNAQNLRGDGTGLGLYIVKSNIENAHGTVGFSSRAGTPTVFWFTLPIKN
jgi:signal transduction histidine kinase